MPPEARYLPILSKPPRRLKEYKVQICQILITKRDNKTTVDSPSTVTPKYNKARRRLLATLGTGGAIGAAASGWVSPVIESVVLPAHATASVTSCTDTDNAGVVSWETGTKEVIGGGADGIDQDADGSTHNIDVSLSEDGDTTGLGDFDVSLDFGDVAMPDTPNVTANTDGSWSALNADVGDLHDNHLHVSVDGLDNIFASNDYNSGGVTVTVTTSDCSTAFNVTVNP